MRRLRTMAITLIIGLVLPATSSAEGVPNGREHVKKQRQIEKAKKQLVSEEKEVKSFASLLQELDTLRLPSDTPAFTRLSAKIRNAMQREYKEVLERVKVAGMEKSPSQPTAREERAGTYMTGDLADPGRSLSVKQTEDGTELSEIAVANRMERIIVESFGLQLAIADGDIDVLPRYRFLLDEFLTLMRSDIEARWTVLTTSTHARQ